MSTIIPPIRHIVRRFLEKEPDIEVIGEAETGEEAVRLVHSLRPDVLVLDHLLPDMSALHLLEQLQSVARILIYTGDPCAQLAQLLLGKGAAGFMAKTDDCTTLADAVRQVARGFVYVSPRLAGSLTLARAVGSATNANESFSARDFDLLRRLADGLSPSEIAEQLRIGERTEREHVKKLCDMLDLKHRYEVAAWAAANGFGRPQID